MKKLYIPVLVLLALLAGFSCGKVKDFAMGPLELADGSAVDDSTYPFESAGDYSGFSIDAVPSNLRFTSAEISTDRAYKGSASLKVGVDYNAGNSGGVLSRSVPNVSLAGNTITARVWVPAGMFPTDFAYGASFFFQLGAAGSYHWYQSTWQNLSLPSGTIPGQWNTITAYVDQMVYAGQTLAQNGESALPAIMWGLKVGQGGLSPNYTGYIYIDSIEMQGL